MWPVARPRILLVPSLTELEWTIRPQLEEWADVASYDAPGIGEEPPAEGLTTSAVAERGLAELDRRGWDRCIVAGDEFGSLSAVLIAEARPTAVQGLMLGHATASYRRTGDRPALNPAVIEGHAQLAEVDFRSFMRHEFRAWHGINDAREDDSSAADAMAEKYLRRVSHEKVTAFHRELIENEETLGALITPALDKVAMPLLLVRHDECLIFTEDGFNDIAVRFPEASTATVSFKPTVDPALVAILREFVSNTTAAVGEPA